MGQDGGGGAVGRLLYRLLLSRIRTSGVVSALAIVPRSRLRELCGHEVLPCHDVATVEGASSMLRWAFEKNAAYPVGSDRCEAALDQGFEAFRLFGLLRTIHQRRLLQEDRSGVRFSIGHVVRHRKLGYRGVIYGWDPRFSWPRAAATQAKALSHLPSGASQPVYYVLPDEVGGRITNAKYVPQDNIEILVGGRVTHRNIPKYFIRYSRRLERYIPVVHLRYLYPDTYLSEEDEDDDGNDPFNVDGTKLVLMKCKRKGRREEAKGPPDSSNSSSLSAAAQQCCLSHEDEANVLYGHGHHVGDVRGPPQKRKYQRAGPYAVSVSVCC